MASKLFIYLMIAISFAASCDPPEQFCNDVGRSAFLENLYSLQPLQKTYKKGDEIIYQMKIPSVNTFFGDTVDIYGETKDEKAYVFGDDDLFVGNKITFQSGNQGVHPNQFYMKYIDGVYSLVFKIELNRPGNYVFGTEQKIHFEGKGDCNFYNIDAFIYNSQGKAEIRFEVLE
jgi:hypothetical protein